MVDFDKLREQRKLYNDLKRLDDLAALGEWIDRMNEECAKALLRMAFVDLKR